MDDLFTKIITIGGGSSAALYFLYYQVKSTKEEVKVMHKEAMVKFDRLTDTMQALLTTTALHAKELEHGDKRFVKMEDEVEMCRASIHNIRNTLHDLKNTMVTHQQLRDLKE